MEHLSLKQRHQLLSYFSILYRDYNKKKETNNLDNLEKSKILEEKKCTLL